MSKKNGRGMYLVVSAPSGAGKTTICREFIKVFPQIRFSVSYTTRPPRRGEVDGRDYHFVSEEDFRRRIDAGEFVEWAENYGYLYGTSGEAVRSFLDKGEDVLLDVEPRGAKALKERYAGGVFVFILPPSLDELRSRLAKRGEAQDVANRRFANALEEIKEVVWYDYIIFNERLDEAASRLQAIYTAEKSRTARLESRIRDFL